MGICININVVRNHKYLNASVNVISNYLVVTFVKHYVDRALLIFMTHVYRRLTLTILAQKIIFNKYCHLMIIKSSIKNTVKFMELTSKYLVTLTEGN